MVSGPRYAHEPDAPARLARSTAIDAWPLVDPVDYLADVLARVPSHPADAMDELLPANWSKTTAPSQLPVAAGV